MTTRPGFPDNPQFPMGLVDVDEDDDTKCTAIISLIQADANRRRDNKDLLVILFHKKVLIFRQLALSSTNSATKMSSKSLSMSDGSDLIDRSGDQTFATHERSQSAFFLTLEIMLSSHALFSHKKKVHSSSESSLKRSKERELKLKVFQN